MWKFRTFGGGSGTLHRIAGELAYPKCLVFPMNGLGVPGGESLVWARVEMNAEVYF